MTRWGAVGLGAGGLVTTSCGLLLAAIFIVGPFSCWIWYPYIDPEVLLWFVLAATLVVSLCVGLLPMTRRWPRVRAWARGAAVAPVVVVALGLAADAWLPGEPPRPNQTQDLVSPSGRFVLSVPIHRAWLPPDNNTVATPVWRLTIADRDGKVAYEDAESRMAGYFNVYWLWDADDRAWLYNSDNGFIYCWEHTDGQWQKRQWGHIEDSVAPDSMAPPAGLMPHHTTQMSESPNP
jgi:hypothetical protein